MFRFAALVVPVFALALAGCGPSKSDIEKSIKDEMKTGLNVEIASVNLTKQADGGYTGTATAVNGDVYDVVAKPPKSGRAEWEAGPSQGMVEKLLREGIEEQTKTKVKSFQLTKQGSAPTPAPPRCRTGSSSTCPARWTAAS